MASPNTLATRTYQFLPRRYWPAAHKAPVLFHDPHQHANVKRTSRLIRSELTPDVRFQRGIWVI